MSSASRTGRDVLPPAKRRRARPEPPPLPEVVVVQRPDHEARQWADLALANATDLEEALAQEVAAHAATVERLEAQRQATQSAIERAETAETMQRLATDELTKERLAHRRSLEQAQADRWQLEEVLAAMSARADAAEAQQQALEAGRRAIGKELADRDIAIAGLTARLESSNAALHRHADQRNKAVLDNHMLNEQVKLLQAQLARVREAAG